MVDEWNLCKKALYNMNKDKFESTNDKNPISSIINKMMSVKENEILQSAIPEDKNLVLMFDGFMTRNEMDFNELPNEIVSWDEKPIASSVEIPEDFEANPQVVKEPRMKNNKQAAMTVLEHSPNMVHCRDDFYVFNDSNGMWECDNKFVLFKKILMNLEDKLVVYSSNESETGKPSNQSYGNTASLMNQVCSIMPSLTVDNHWYTRVNESGKMKLPFKDGIYDFKKGEWEEGFDPEIPFFDSIPFNFPKRDEEVIKEVNKAFFETPFQNERLSTGVYFKRRLAIAFASLLLK